MSVRVSSEMICVREACEFPHWIFFAEKLTAGYIFLKFHFLWGKLAPRGWTRASADIFANLFQQSNNFERTGTETFTTVESNRIKSRTLSLNLPGFGFVCEAVLRHAETIRNASQSGVQWRQMSGFIKTKINKMKFLLHFCVEIKLWKRSWSFRVKFNPFPRSSGAHCDFSLSH